MDDLPLEAQLQIRQLELEAQQLDLNQARQMVADLSRQNIVQRELFKAMLRGRWGMPEGDRQHPGIGEHN